MKPKLIICLLSLTTFSPIICLADNQTPNPVDDIDGTSPGTASALKGTNQASLTGAAGATKVTGRLTHNWQTSSNSNGFWTGSVIANVPLTNSSAPKPDAGTLSQLTTTTNTRFDVGYVIWPTPTAGSDKSKSSICTRFIKMLFGPKAEFIPGTKRKGLDSYDLAQQYPIETFDGGQSCDALMQDNDLIASTLKNLNAAITKSNADDAKAAAAAKDNSWLPIPEVKLPNDAAPNDQQIRDIQKAAFAEFQKAQEAGFKPAWIIGGSVAGSQGNYSYVNASSPQNILKESAEGYGFGGNVSLILQSTVVTINYSYEKPIKGGETTQVCSPIGVTSSTSCSNASVGLPKRSTARIYGIEFRSEVAPKFALEPRLEFDSVSSNYGVRLPLYFVPDVKKNLSGGIVLGWTRANHFQSGVVLTTNFGFFN